MDGLEALCLRLLDDVLVDIRELDGDAGRRGRRRRACSRRGRSCCGGRRLIRLRDGAELFHEVRDVDDVLRLAVADAVDHLRQRVDAFEQRVDDVFVELQLLFADEVEDVLHLMRELGNLVEAHRRRHAFQRVRVAEDLVDDRGLLHVVLEAQQAIVQRLQMLMRLVEEHIHVLIRIHIGVLPFGFLYFPTAATMARAMSVTGRTSSARPASTTDFGMP